MARGRVEEALIRRWRLIELLDGRREGVTVRWLVDELGASQATVYRDLGLLRRAGVPIDVDPIDGGEARYRLVESAGANGSGLTRLQHAAVRLARESLSGLEGTRLVAELDGLTLVGS